MIRQVHHLQGVLIHLEIDRALKLMQGPRLAVVQGGDLVRLQVPAQPELALAVLEPVLERVEAGTTVYRYSPADIEQLRAFVAEADAAMLLQVRDWRPGEPGPD